MKITKKMLKQLIKEELNENIPAPSSYHTHGRSREGRPSKTHASAQEFGQVSALLESAIEGAREAGMRLEGMLARSLGAGGPADRIEQLIDDAIAMLQAARDEAVDASSAKLDLSPQRRATPREAEGRGFDPAQAIGPGYD